MSSSHDRKKQVHQFCQITGASKDIAKRVLKACNFNVEMAINMHVESEVDDSTNGNVPALGGAVAPAAAAAAASIQPLPDMSDDVRAPIPPVEEVLVEGTFSAGLRSRRRVTRSVFDGFRDFQAETREQELQMLNDSLTTRATKKQKTLEDLFRPPLDLMHRGSFDSARKVGQNSNKWLMVNIQNVQEFPCQVLNRDVWSNQAVKAAIREHFVFWQVYHDSEEGQRYMQFYRVLDWPYVGILDPRTGEQIVVWNQIDSTSFCDLVSEFLKSNPSLDGSMTCLTSQAKRLRSDSILDASEDSQLEAAIRASLTEASGKKRVSAAAGSSNEFGVASTSGCSRQSPSSNHGASQSPVVMVEDIADEDDDDEVETFDTDSNDSMIGKPAEKGTNMKAESPSSAKVPETQSLLDWRLYLGTPEEPKSNVNVRYPDGSKDQFIVPASSKLQALLLYVQSKGFLKETYELITNFPRRLLSDLDSNISMKDAGLYPQETVFVQSR